MRLRLVLYRVVQTRELSCAARSCHVATECCGFLVTLCLCLVSLCVPGWVSVGLVRLQVCLLKPCRGGWQLQPRGMSVVGFLPSVGTVWPAGCHLL